MYGLSGQGAPSAPERRPSMRGRAGMGPSGSGPAYLGGYGTPVRKGQSPSGSRGMGFASVPPESRGVERLPAGMNPPGPVFWGWVPPPYGGV